MSNGCTTPGFLVERTLRNHEPAGYPFFSASVRIGVTISPAFSIVTALSPHSATAASTIASCTICFDSPTSATREEEYFPSTSSFTGLPFAPTDVGKSRYGNDNVMSVVQTFAPSRFHGNLPI